jgi:DNA-binding response OmpR family regulator
MAHDLPDVDPAAGARLAWGVLLITDDPSLAPPLRDALAHHGMGLATSALTGGRDALLRPAGHCAVVVDARRDLSRGLQALEGLRHRAGDLPLLALLPAHDASAALASVPAGANDFVCSDHPQAEIVVRLCVLKRRAAVCERLVAGDLALAPRERRVWLGARQLSLRGRQFDLLHVLMRHAGQVVSRPQIQAGLALDGDVAAGNVIEVHVHHLRRLIGAERVLTVRGQGYRLVT